MLLCLILVEPLNKAKYKLTLINFLLKYGHKIMQRGGYIHKSGIISRIPFSLIRFGIAKHSWLLLTLPVLLKMAQILHKS